MKRQNRLRIYPLLVVLWMFAACGPGGGDGPTPAPQTAEPSSDTVEAESSRDGVVTIGADGQRQPLPSPNETRLGVGEGVDVDASGRAILRFADLLTVEVLRDGGLTLQELAVDEQAASITALQNGGALVNDFNPEQEIDRRFALRTEFAEVVATGTRFLMVREADTPLEWVVTMRAREEDLTVTANGETRSLWTGLARWVAPVGPPSDGIDADMGSVQEWLANVRRGAVEQEIGEILWPQADVVANTRPLQELPPVGEPFELGGVEITLDPQGLFGDPAYRLEDCNNDGIRDVAMQAGRLHMDFRPVPSRVRAVDVTVVNRGQAGSGSLQGLDPGENEIGRTQLEVGPGEGQILSLRSEPGEPYHYARLSMGDGCFLGLSLTPPSNGEPGAPKPAVEEWPPEIVVEPEAARCEVASSGLNLRTGPGLVYPQITALRTGTQLEPLVQSPDGEWILVRVRATGQGGWVNAGPRYLSCNLDVGTLPVAEVIPPTPTPTPTITPSPTPSPTPTVKPYAVPRLLEPEHETTFYERPVTLRWEWDGRLGPNEYFDVRVWYGGQAHTGIDQTDERSYTIGARNSIWRFGPGWYHWQIVVVEARNGQVVRELSAPSQEWAFEWVRGRPDLVVQELAYPEVDCDSYGCETTVTFTVANVGEADAGPFDVLVATDPDQQRTVRVDGLAAGEARTLTVTSPVGGNCYNPDCTVCVRVDPEGEVSESGEQNNEDCRTTIG